MAWAQDNEAPVAQHDTTEAFGDAVVYIDVLANDSDPDGDPLTLVDITQEPGHGFAQIVLQQQREVIGYLPDPDFTGRDELTYRIEDPSGAAATAKVFIDVRTNEAPVAVNDSAGIFVGDTLVVDVLANDSDPDDDAIAIDRISVVPRRGTAQIVGTGSDQRIRYVPNADFAGTDSLTYVIADEPGAIAAAQLFITVVRNEAPVAVNDTLTVRSNVSSDLDVLANDTDAEGDAISILNVPEPPVHGTVELIGDRIIRYIPDPGFLGTDQFQYAITDSIARQGTLVGDVGTVVLTVLVPNGVFEVNLSGANVLPATNSRATGLVTATLVDNVLSFSGTFSSLESPFDDVIGARVYEGAAGRAGPSVIDLSASVGTQGRNGTFLSADNSIELTPDQRQALLERRLYLSVSSEAFPGGEIRGQLLPTDPDAIFRAVFSGRAVVPANDSPARGGALGELYGNTVLLSGGFGGLSSDYEDDFGDDTLPGGLLLRPGDLGVVGGTPTRLTPTVSIDQRSGTFVPEANVVALTGPERRQMQEGLYYLQVRTEDHPGGEIRGQLLPRDTRVFEATLAGRNAVPRTASDATGGLYAVLDGLTLVVAGTFEGLEGNLDLSGDGGVQLRRGTPGEEGEPLFELLPALAAGTPRSGSFGAGNNQLSLTPSQRDDLFAGRLFVAIDTEAYPEAEIRGHLVPSLNVMPEATFVNSPADGSTIVVSGNPEAPFAVSWEPTRDPNGTPVFYRWQLATSPSFGEVLFETPPLGDTRFEMTLGEVGTLLMANGIEQGERTTLYHRIVTTDGSLAQAGPPAALTLTRGALTGTDGSTDLPASFALHGNYPNPFNPTTRLRFDLPEAAEVRVEVFDVLGRMVLTMPARRMAAGADRSAEVDARALPSGLYVYRLTARTDATTHTATGRMLLVK